MRKLIGTAALVIATGLLACGGSQETPDASASPAPIVVAPADPWEIPEDEPTATPEEVGDAGCRSGDLLCQMRAASRSEANGPADESPPPHEQSKGFDRAAAAAALARASAEARSCARPGDPVVQVRMLITFGAHGRPSNVAVGSPSIAGTRVADCVERVFYRATVPSFEGGPVSVTKAFSIP